MDSIDSGLQIDEKEFMSMGRDQKLLCLFRNQVATLKAVTKFRFNQKVQYGALAVLFTIGTILLTMHLK